MELLSGVLFIIWAVGRCCFGRQNNEVVLIGKPEYQCSQDGQIIETTDNFTRIRLAKRCQALFSLNTERTSSCINSQKCTLMTWKIIRDLEMYLNNNFNFTSDTGVIYFNNNMVVPGFNYLLHITLKKDGRIMERDFNLTFFEQETNRHEPNIHGNLDLNVGNNRLYPSLPTIINANVTLCGDVDLVYYTWHLVTSHQDVVLPQKSSELLLTPSYASSNCKSTCTVRCEVINYQNNVQLLQESLQLITANEQVPITNIPQLEVELPFIYSTFNKGAPIIIQPYFFNNNINFKIKWSCSLENSFIFECENQLNDQFYLESGFAEEGNYTITLTVKTSTNQTIVKSCNVLVLSDVPSIEFDLNLPLRAEKGVTIIAKVSELRTYCVVRWLGDEDNKVDLSSIPGFSYGIYNISSKDKSFLEEMVEWGKITVTRDFTLKLPLPSRLYPGLKPAYYKLKLTATCPTMSEINDVAVTKDQPESFITVSGVTSFTIPPSPSMKSLNVIPHQEGVALLSEYTYVVEPVYKPDLEPMLYKYGFVLNGVEVVVYSGVNIFSAKTVLPCNGELGVDTYVEVCDSKDVCAKHFGPVVTPTINGSLSEKVILKSFRQKLVEENFYQVFAYLYLVEYSSKFSNECGTYSNLLSSELLVKVNELINNDSDKVLVNNFISNLALFIDQLEFSEEVMLALSRMTNHFLTNSRYTTIRHVRDASFDLPSDKENIKKLEEMENYIKTSEYLIVNSLNTDAIASEKEHLLNLIDGWMVEACHLLYRNKQRTFRIEMNTIVLFIDQSQRFQQTLIFDNHIGNVSFQIKMDNLPKTHNLCLGQVVLKDFFNDKSVDFGANIYYGDDDDIKINRPVEIRVILPTLRKLVASECKLYNNGWKIQCLSTKEHEEFYECICPSFGYYFVGPSSTTFSNQTDLTINATEFSNNTNNDVINAHNNRNIGQKISYVIIVSSLVGFLILCYIIRKLTIYPQHNIHLDGFNDNNCHYGHVMDGDFLD